MLKRKEMCIRDSLNKVTDVYLDDGTQRIELEDDKLYRVVADLYLSLIHI